MFEFCRIFARLNIARVEHKIVIVIGTRTYFRAYARVCACVCARACVRAWVRVCVLNYVAVPLHIFSLPPQYA